MNDRQQSSTSRPIVFFMVLSSDHITPATGKTVSVSLSKDGGAFAAAAGAVSEIANGWYKLAGNATDRDTLGDLILRATATGCDDTPKLITIVPWDPFDATRLGLSALPNASAAANGGLPTVDASNAVKVQSGTGANQISLAAGLVTVGTNNDKTGYSLAVAPPTAAAIATQVWSEALPGSYTSGQAGFKLNAAGSAADPWSTALPGAYSAGSAGYIIGNNLNAAVGSRMATFALPANFSTLAITVGGAVTVGTNNDKSGYSLNASEHSGIQADVTSGLTTQGYTTARAPKLDQLDVAVSSRLATAGYTAPDNAGIANIYAAVDTEVAAIKAKTDNLPSTVDGKTLTQWFQVVAAMLAGQVSGAGSGTEVFKGLDGATTRVTVTVDGSGNRTAVVYS